VPLPPFSAAFASQVHLEHGLLHRLAIDGLDIDALLGSDDHLAVIDEVGLAGEAEDGGDVGGDEVLTLAQSGDERAEHGWAATIAPGCASASATAAGSRGCPSGSAASPSRSPLVVLPSTVAALRCPSESGRCAPPPAASQLEVVLDDAVVHDGDVPSAVQVRMRVRHRGRSMGGQRVCPMPERPRAGRPRAARRAPRACPSPSPLRCVHSPGQRRPSHSLGTPAGASPEQYFTVSRLPRYPTMPHIRILFFSSDTRNGRVP
jgi:hypothetical protein